MVFGIPLDHLNAGFEMIGAAFRVYDCVKLYRAKHFVGGSILTVVFFFTWGLFNTFFYPSLNQSWSFVAAIFLTAANGVWILMALFYEKQMLLRRLSKTQ
jgi:hypothetical protein